jgi:hypothetical protein
MNSDLDLVTAYMNDEDGDVAPLTSARSALHDAIAAELRKGATKPTRTTKPGHTRRRPVVRWSLGVATAAAVVAFAGVEVLPSPRTTTSEAAAAQIDRLADAATPVPPLAPGQWYQSELQGAVSLSVSSVGTTPTPDAQASIPLTSEEWSNATGAGCTSQQFGRASFATAANAQAWAALGLADTLANQPATSCGAGPSEPLSVGVALPLIDVSTITHDPATLATQLQDGTTGIPTLDDLPVGGPENGAGAENAAGFIRLTRLLVGPTSGQWSGFGQEVLQTMALLPGVISVGTSTAHSGKSGPAFSVKPTVQTIPEGGSPSSVLTSPPAVVLDPQTGSLLEARNVPIPVLQVALQNLVGTSDAARAQGDGYEAVTEWIDPVASLSVVDQSALPSWIGTIHIVEAVALPSTTQQQVVQAMKPFSGSLETSPIPSSSSGTPDAGQTVYDLTFTGTAASVAPVVAALNASGLFASVSVKL